MSVPAGVAELNQEWANHGKNVTTILEAIRHIEIKQLSKEMDEAMAEYLTDPDRCAIDVAYWLNHFKPMILAITKQVRDNTMKWAEMPDDNLEDGSRRLYRCSCCEWKTGWHLKRHLRKKTLHK